MSPAAVGKRDELLLIFFRCFARSLLVDDSMLLYSFEDVDCWQRMKISYPQREYNSSKKNDDYRQSNPVEHLEKRPFNRCKFVVCVSLIAVALWLIVHITVNQQDPTCFREECVSFIVSSSSSHQSAHLDCSVIVSSISVTPTVGRWSVDICVLNFVHGKRSNSAIVLGNTNTFVGEFVHRSITSTNKHTVLSCFFRSKLVVHKQRRNRPCSLLLEASVGSTRQYSTTRADIRLSRRTIESWRLSRSTKTTDRGSSNWIVSRDIASSLFSLKKHVEAEKIDELLDTLIEFADFNKDQRVELFNDSVSHRCFFSFHRRMKISLSEARSLWSLVQIEEFVYSFVFKDRSSTPKIRSTCGNVFTVERAHSNELPFDDNRGEHFSLSIYDLSNFDRRFQFWSLTDRIGFNEFAFRSVLSSSSIRHWPSMRSTLVSTFVNRFIDRSASTRILKPK